MNSPLLHQLASMLKGRRKLTTCNSIITRSRETFRGMVTAAARAGAGKELLGRQTRSPTHPSRNRRSPQSRGAKILPSPAQIAGIAARAAAQRESGLATVSLPLSVPVPQASLAPSRSKLPVHARPSQPNGRALQYPGASKRGPSVAIGAASHASGPASLADGSCAAAATAATPSHPRRPIMAAARTTLPPSLNTRAMSRAKGGATSTASAVAAVDAADVAVAATAAADDPDDDASANTDADADANTDAVGAAGAARLNETSRPPLQLPPTPTPTPTPRQLLLLDSLAQVGVQLPSLSLIHPRPAPSPPPPPPPPPTHL